MFSALYGVLFPNKAEAAFSNYRLWESVGFVVAFSYGGYVTAKISFKVITLPPYTTFDRLASRQS